MSARLDPNFYAIRQAFDRGSKAARDFIVARKAYPVAGEPSNPERSDLEDIHAAWSDGFVETMRRHGGWQ